MALLHGVVNLRRTFRLRRFGNWLALIGWVGVIFWFSSQPDLKSALETWQDVILRKGAHMAEYFVLAYWWLRCRGVERQWSPSAAATAVLFALAVAGADEWYQTTVRGRHGSPYDVFVDLGGVAILLLLHWRLNPPVNQTPDNPTLAEKV